MPAAFCGGFLIAAGFEMRAPSAHIQHMPSKPIELPPAVARRFVEDMRAFFVEKNTIRPMESRLANFIGSSSITQASCASPT